MKPLYWFLPVPLIAGAVFAVLAACNTGTDDCPDKAQITPGAACSDDFAQCAFDLQTPSVACDGTTFTIASSCTCTKGLWVCPSAVECGEDAATDEGGDATDDGGDATGDGATDDASTDDGATTDSATDDSATPDAADAASDG
jgi:hypothetical protein